jgi:hypothetical protein
MATPGGGPSSSIMTTGLIFLDQGTAWRGLAAGPPLLGAGVSI